MQPATPRLAPAVLAAYGGPVFAVAYLLFFLQFYFLKYATDVLLLSPAVVSLLFGPMGGPFTRDIAPIRPTPDACARSADTLER